jgi:hypothetical protein
MGPGAARPGLAEFIARARRTGKPWHLFYNISPSHRPYQVNPAVNFSLDVANLFNEPQQLYAGFPNRVQDVILNFITVTAGISGRF